MLKWLKKRQCFRNITLNIKSFIPGGRMENESKMLCESLVLFVIELHFTP